MDDKKVSQLIELVKSEQITPEQALEAYEDVSQHISELPSDVRVEVRKTGLSFLDRHKVFKSNIPELVVVAARPGTGKSALMLQIAEYVSRTENVLFFNLEMRPVTLWQRIARLISTKDIERLESNPLLREEVRTKMSELNFRVISSGGLSISDIYNKARHVHKRYPLGLIVVDYLQIVYTSAGRSRTEEVKHIMLELRKLSEELNCTVLTASQLNRNAETRGASSRSYGDFTPRLGDLAESDSIGKDSDVVFFINRENAETNILKPEADIVIAKNRSGMIGRGELMFSEVQTKFFEASTSSGDWT